MPSGGRTLEACKERAIADISPNRLLASLAAEDSERLRPHLKPIELEQGAVLFEPGQKVDRVYFPNSAIISLVVELSAGQAVEAAMIGRDGILGAASALDYEPSLNTAVVQLPGMAESLEIGSFRKVAEASASLRISLRRHESFLFAQAQQSAACSASHTIERRLPRLLLQTRDLSGADDLPFTQDSLARRLGARRSNVSPIARTLQQAGLIRYSRGHLQILNLRGLRRASCECYRTVKAHYDRLVSNQKG
jgi:CRP-like cAMP-binding protein